MNVSEPFILRPVGTTLLMAAIMLSGIVAYTFLPLSTLPEVDYPTIQVQTFYPGASPEVMTSSVTAPLERQLGQMPGLNQMTSASSAGASIITLQFSLDLSLDVAEQEVQAAINAANNLLPSDLPIPPVYAKINPADAPILTLAVTSKTMSLTDLEDLSETRLAQKISQLNGVGLVSISGGHRPGGAHPVQSAIACRLRPQHRRRPHHGRQLQRQHAEGKFRRPGPGHDDQRQRPDRQRRAICQHRHRLSQRQPGSALGCGKRRQRRGEHQARRLGEHHAGDHSQCSAAAGRQHHRGGRPHQDLAAAHRLHPAGGGRCRRAQRPHRHHPRLGRRRRIRARARGRPRRGGDLPVLAHAARHHHSQPVGAAVAGRHARRDVPARLQPRQSCRSWR